MIYQIAPMEGITTFAYRQLHQTMFGGAQQYFTPFFVPTQERKLSTKEARDLAPENNAGCPVIPQVLTKRPEDVLWAAEQVAALGYGELNVNLGCPAGTIVSKGKGSGMLADVDGLDRFLDEIFAQSPLPISVKTRLGIHAPEEFATILAVYNRYPISHLTIHTRVQKDFYKLPARPDWFTFALENTNLPLTYNGDLLTQKDVEEAQARWDTQQRWMLGRGVISDPALLRKLAGGESATREELTTFTDALYKTYQEAYGHKGTAAQRMKELWFYMIHLFEDNQRLDKKMRRSSRYTEFEDAQRAILGELPLKQEL